MPQVHSLFASPVIAEIDDDLDTEPLKKDKFTFQTLQHRGYNNISEIGKDVRILEKYPTLEKQLLKKWEKAAYHIFNYRNDFKITTSWITRSKKGSQSTVHLHKNSFFSGLLYYGKYNDKSGGIQFVSPIHSHSDFYLKANPPNILSSDTHSFTPHTNLLMFFPSYLKHRIMYHEDNAPRYSLAFNIVPIGLYGSNDSQYNTEWLT